jgi:hypothetical protein
VNSDASLLRCSVTEERLGAGFAGVGTVPVQDAAATAGAGQTLISRMHQLPCSHSADILLLVLFFTHLSSCRMFANLDI